jgi:hypothetical protein
MFILHQGPANLPSIPCIEGSGDHPRVPARKWYRRDLKICNVIPSILCCLLVIYGQMIALKRLRIPFNPKILL